MLVKAEVVDGGEASLEGETHLGPRVWLITQIAIVGMFFVDGVWQQLE